MKVADFFSTAKIGYSFYKLICRNGPYNEGSMIFPKVSISIKQGF
jgi:hypothetical protein